MDIIQKMKQSESEYAAAELKVYRTVTQDPTLVMRYTISQIAMMADTSVAAVLRFTQHLGFKGYKDFRYEIMNWQKESGKKEPDQKDIVSLLSENYANAVSEISKLDRSVLRDLCNDIRSADKVIILGRHRTSTAAEKLRMNLTDLGITAITGSDLLAFHHLLYIIDEKTAVLMFSTTGEVTEQKEFLSQLSAANQKTWLFTPVSKSKMSRYASHTIVLPSASVTHVFAGSQVIMMAFSDILTALLSEEEMSEQ